MDNYQFFSKPISIRFLKGFLRLYSQVHSLVPQSCLNLGSSKAGGSPFCATSDLFSALPVYEGGFLGCYNLSQKSKGAGSFSMRASLYNFIQGQDFPFDPKFPSEVASDFSH